MNRAEFKIFMLQKTELIKTIFSMKQQQYSTEFDQFHGFKKAAQLRDTSPEDILMGQMIKHVIALQDFIEAIKKGRKIELAAWNEKTMDVACYMILLNGLAKDRAKKGI